MMVAEIPNNIAILAFIFGAILVMVAIVGGTLRLPGSVQVPAVRHTGIRIAAAVVGASLIMFGIVRDHPVPTTTTTPTSSTGDVMSPTNVAVAPGASGATVATGGTGACQPAVAETLVADNIGRHGADIHGKPSPNDVKTKTWFELGTTPEAKRRIEALNGTGIARGLDADTKYYYRYVAQNDCGTTPGQLQQFVTLSNPIPECPLAQDQKCQTTYFIAKGDSPTGCSQVRISWRQSGPPRYRIVRISAAGTVTECDEAHLPCEFKLHGHTWVLFVNEFGVGSDAKVTLQAKC
jgi:hypothetical protein